MRERERVTRFRHRAEHSRRSFCRAASTSGDPTNPVIIAQRSRIGSTALRRAVQVPQALHPGAVVQISRGRILTPSFERSETEHPPFAARLASEWPPRPRRSRQRRPLGREP
ncbi:hypothetical protein [Nocardia beijingensis]|uniref:Uncharacterized protein n=1 Tax=Nocardia beijingensis TaxID=95162 RepID=A0ABW7WA78_9NOCA